MPLQGFNSRVSNNDRIQQDFGGASEASAHRPHAASYLGASLVHSLVKTLHKLPLICRQIFEASNEFALVMLKGMVEIKKIEQLHQATVLVMPAQRNRWHSMDETVDQAMIAATDRCIEVRYHRPYHARYVGLHNRYVEVVQQFRVSVRADHV
jgi:succinate dehydrogenase/fumarate reductase flavoprotein subunit